MRALKKDDKIASAELNLHDVMQEGTQFHELRMKTERETNETPTITFTTEYLTFQGHAFISSFVALNTHG